MTDLGLYRVKALPEAKGAVADSCLCIKKELEESGKSRQMFCMGVRTPDGFDFADSSNSFNLFARISNLYLYSCIGSSPVRAPSALKASDSISPSPGMTITGARKATCFFISSTQYLL